MKSSYRRFHILACFVLCMSIPGAASFAAGQGPVDREGTVSLLAIDYMSEDGQLACAEMRVTLHVSQNEKYRLRATDGAQLQVRAGEKIKVKGVKLGKNRQGEEEMAVIMYAPGNGGGNGGGGGKGGGKNSGHPPYTFSSVPGSLKVAVVLIASLDNPCKNATREAAETLMYDGAENVRDLWLEDSNGELELLRDADANGLADVFGPYVAPYYSTDNTSELYNSNYNDYVAFANAQAAGEGVNLGSFDKVMWVMPQNNWGYSWAGMAQVGGRNLWDNHGSLFVKAHELNHTLGLSHAGDDPEDDGIYNYVYADRSCVQGIPYRNVGLNIPMAYEMGFLRTKGRNSEVEQLPSKPGVYDYRLYAKQYDETSLKAVYFDREQPDAYWPTTRYYLSCRDSTGYDANLAATYQAGLHIHRHIGAGYVSSIIKTLTTGGSHVFDWAPVMVTQLDQAADGSYTDIRVEVW